MQLLTVIIPGRNEMFMSQTISNVIANIRGDTSILAICDGYWPDPVIADHPLVNLIHYSESIGQRAATNVGVNAARSKFIMKLDAHCAVDEGFDVKLTDPYLKGELDGDVTTVPTMFNLHAFDWVCKCGHRIYQGPTPDTCPACSTNNRPFTRDILWRAKPNPRSNFMRFDSDLHFQYWKDYGKRPEAQGEICDLMSFIGACWLMSRHRYRKLGILDERHGSWGQVGTEVACASWLSGGRLVVNKRSWFAHMFRTQGGDFGFPYKISNRDQRAAQTYSNDLWKKGKWKRQTRPLSWLLEKFWPIPGWTDKQLNSLRGN